MQDSARMGPCLLCQLSCHDRRLLQLLLHPLLPLLPHPTHVTASQPLSPQHLQAISAKLGVPHPSLADVAAAAGCPITLAATSLARRAPVYLSSTTHPDMPVRDALRGAQLAADGARGQAHQQRLALHRG
jgi:hypothetical protein